MSIIGHLLHVVCVVILLYRERAYSQISATTRCDVGAQDPDMNSTLDLENCGLENLDTIVPGYREIKLANNSLTKIPTFLQNYTSLITLDLTNNSIAYIPSSLNLANIKTLTLDDNPFESFDKDFLSFSNLESLSLRRTKFTRLPNVVEYFPSLRNLYASDIGLEYLDTYFPADVKKLDLSNNSLREIPQGIYNLGYLEYLNLAGNPLDQLNLTLSVQDFKSLSNVKVLYMNKLPELNDSCSTEDIKVLKYKEAEGKSSWETNVCIFATPPEPKMYRSSNSPPQWVLILIVVIFLGFFLVGFVFVCCCIPRRIFCNKAKKINSQISQPIRHFQGQGYSPYTMLDDNFRETLIEIVTASEAPTSNISDAQHPRHSSTKIYKYNNSYSVTTLYDNLQVFRINLSDLTDIKSIGAGGFAVVWLVIYKSDRYLASKRLRTDDLRILSPPQMEAFVQEIQMVSMLKHRNIVEFVGVAWDGADQKVNLQMLFEFMEGGDLKDCLSKTVDDSQHTVLPRYWNHSKITIARDIASALVYLHSFHPPLLHRDLKARNILLSTDCSTAKLSDFGVARIRSQNTTTMTGCVGTGRWLAPEILNGAKKYTEACDIYSFGIVLMELDTHEIPFGSFRHEDNELMPDIYVLLKIAMGELDPMVGFSSKLQEGDYPVIYDLAKKCLSSNPANRPSAMSIVQALEELAK